MRSDGTIRCSLGCLKAALEVLNGGRKLNPRSPSSACMRADDHCTFGFPGRSDAASNLLPS